MRRPSAWAGLPTLVVTWLAFAQVLSLPGLTIWVIGGSVLAYGLVTALAGTGHRMLAMLAAVATTAILTLLANTLGGDSAGPITRAALMAVGVGAALGLILRTQYPAALLAAAVILLGGATGLGAAGRAPWLVGAWAVAAAVTLVMLGPYVRSDLADPRRLSRLVAILAVSGLMAVVMIAMATPLLRVPWTMPGAAAINDTTATTGPDATDATPPPPDDSPADDSTPSEPPPTEPSPSQPPQTPPPTAVADHGDQQDQTDPTDPTDPVDVTSTVVAIIVSIVLALIALVAARLAWQAVIWLQWRRLRNRLQRGGPARSIAGAWTWVRLRRQRYDDPLPVFASPDVVADSTVRTDPSTRDVARLAALVAFDSRAMLDADDADQAWAAAQRAGQPPAGSSLRRRWRWGRRRPASVRRDLSAHT